MTPRHGSGRAIGRAGPAVLGSPALPAVLGMTSMIKNKTPIPYTNYQRDIPNPLYD